MGEGKKEEEKGKERDFQQTVGKLERPTGRL